MAMLTNEGKDFKQLDITANLTDRASNDPTELSADITGHRLIIDQPDDGNDRISPSTYALAATNDPGCHRVIRYENGNIRDAKFICSFENPQEARKYVNELNDHVDLPDTRLKRLVTTIVMDLLEQRSTIHLAIMLTLSAAGYDQTQDFQAINFAHDTYERGDNFPDQLPFVVSECFAKLAEVNMLTKLYASLEYFYRYHLTAETSEAVVIAVLEKISRKK